MPKKFAAQLLVVQMVAVAITALRTVKHLVAMTDAVAIIALMSVANSRVIDVLVSKLWSRFSVILRHTHL